MHSPKNNHIHPIFLMHCNCRRICFRERLSRREIDGNSVVAAVGGKKREDIYEAFESIYPVLQEFRKGEAAPSAQALPSAAPARALPVRTPPIPSLSAIGTQLCMQRQWSCQNM
jgi:hypothetical protein